MEGTPKTDTQRLPYLVLDTNAFVKLLNLNELAQKYRLVTSDGVLSEIRDKRARENVDAFAFGLDVVECSENGINFIKRFAHATGDLATLSAIDQDLLAVAYTLAEREGKVAHFRREPQAPKEKWAKRADEDEDDGGDQDETQRDEEQKQEGDENGDEGWVTVTATAAREAKVEYAQKQDEQTGDSTKQAPQVEQQEEKAPVQSAEGAAASASTAGRKKRHKQRFLASDEQEEEHGKTAPQSADTQQQVSAVQENSADTEARENSAQQARDGESAFGGLDEKDLPLQRITPDQNGGVGDDQEEVVECDNDEEFDEDSDDNGEGWINHRNIDKYLAKSREIDERTQGFGIFIMTADYAMQNVALQMGLPVLSLDGMLVRRTKRFVLECYACHRLCRDVTKRFCPDCGNNALLKVSCSVTDGGELILYRKKDFRVNTKGFVFSIPKPKTGRNHRKQDHIILREDELLIGGKKQLLRRQEAAAARGGNNLLSRDDGWTGPFDDAYSKKQRPDQAKIIVPYSKINPAQIFHKKSQKKK